MSCCLIIVIFAIATVPAISDCPSFVGPTTVNNNTQVEFYCDVNTSATDSRSMFNVSFLFDFQVDPDVPPEVLTLTNLRATLHEQYLAGRLNKAVRWTSISIFSVTIIHSSNCYSVFSVTHGHITPYHYVTS